MQGKQDENTLIVVQRFRPNAFFTVERQKRFQEMTNRFHDASGLDKSTAQAVLYSSTPHRPRLNKATIPGNA
jgi:hypothetical protein